MMFESIIQYFIEKGELHERAAYDVRLFATFLENQTKYTQLRLQEVITQFNHQTLQPTQISGQNNFPHLEFWRGVDDFKSTVGLSYDGAVDILSNLEPVVKSQFDNAVTTPDAERIVELKARMSIKIDLHKYPISLLGYYDYKFNSTALFYAWMAYLWQEVEGYQCGLKVKTVQNNSIEQFSLNDFLDGDFSKFTDLNYDDKPVPLEQYFPRNLTLTELFLRACQIGYPFNPYKNYWRYFEKEDEFTEIVTYECATGIRFGKLAARLTAEVGQIKQHENPKAALLYLTDFTDQAIFNGWEEKFRPHDLPEKMHDTAYNFEFWTGIFWYDGDEKKNKLKAETIHKFEENHSIKLPPAFFHYLRLFNGRQYNSHNLHFPVNDWYTVEIKKFYTLGELNNLITASLSVNPNFLRIGVLENGEFLSICVQSESRDYGKVAIEKEESIQIYDYSFEKFAQYAQSSPVQPEIFAAQENNLSFLKKRLAEGWDFNTEYSYQDAVNAAAEHNSYEVLEFLLQHGARIRTKNHRDMSWVYDERTMDLLDKYTQTP